MGFLRIEEAKQTYEAALRQDPSNADLFYNVYYFCSIIPMAVLKTHVKCFFK